MKKHFFLSLLCASAATLSAGNLLEIPAAAETPVIDGVMAPAEWDDAAVFTGLQLTNDRGLANEQTRFYMKWDKDFIYIAAVCSDSNVKGISSKIPYDDCLEFFFMAPGELDVVHWLVYATGGNTLDFIDSEYGSGYRGNPGRIKNAAKINEIGQTISGEYAVPWLPSDFKKKNGLTVDTYNIFVNNDQIYKPYTGAIYEDNNGGKKKVDDIMDVDFLMARDNSGSIIYWGWYSISTLKGQMKPKNIARGIRLRKENIQIGGEICKKFFTKTTDEKFSFYFFGEIHALSKGLIPNSRRDYFSESKECVEFEQKIRQDFLKLKDLCYDASKLRSSNSAIAKAEELRATIQNKEENGYTSQQERNDLYHRLVEQEKREKQAQKQLVKVKDKISSNDSPLKSVLVKFETPVSSEEQPKKDFGKEIPDKDNKTKYRTDKPIYSRYSRNEKKLIGKIYTAIGNAIADERLREALISNIEEQITK